MFDLIRKVYSDGYLRYVCIEAGHKHAKANWHKAKNIYTAQAISRDVGRNNAVGEMIQDFCVEHDVPYILVPPNGYSKVDARMFKLITKYDGRTNPDTRAAGMIAFEYGTRGEIRAIE